MPLHAFSRVQTRVEREGLLDSLAPVDFSRLQWDPLHENLRKGPYFPCQKLWASGETSREQIKSHVLKILNPTPKT